MSQLSRFTIEQVRTATYKRRDAWWTVLLVDPLASRLVQLAARYRWITPNRLTVAAFLLGAAAAGCFAMADYPWLVAGAVLFHLSFVVDCMDGKIARLMGTGSVFGAWLDYVVDRARVLVCTIGLMGGQYAATGRIAYILLGAAVVFLDLFRYLDALQISRVNQTMRSEMQFLAQPGTEAATDAGTTDVATTDVVDQAMIGLYRESLSRIPGFDTLHRLLVGSRIRSHLFSGIEFQMAVFIVAPLTGALIAVPLVAGALLLIFEAALILKLWLATRAFTRQMRVRTLSPPIVNQPDGAHHTPESQVGAEERVAG